VIGRSQASGLPRAVEAMRFLKARMRDAVVVIGNAPTALLAVLDLVDAGEANPALIIGTPVGYVAAVESKQELILRQVPYITVQEGEEARLRRGRHQCPAPAQRRLQERAS